MASEQPPSPRTSPTPAALAEAPSAALRSERDSNDDIPSSTTAAPAAIPARPASPPNQMTDPVAALQAAFPSMDRTIITEVLAAHGGNPDSASMALLEISGTTNPTSPTHPNAASGEHTKNAQMLADEAYARELMAQMEREHMQEYGRPIDSRPPQQQQASQEIDYNRLNYQPRQQRNRFGQPVGGNASQTQQQYGQGGHQEDDGRGKYQDELDQLTEQFGKIADTGKKTFNSLLSKAKDKYAQVQQQQREYAQQQRDGVPTASTNAGTGTTTTTIAGYTIPSIPAPWQGGFGSKAGVVGHASNQRPASPRDTVRAGAMSPEGRESVMKDYSATSPLGAGRPRYESRTSLDDDAPPIQIKRPSSSSATMPIPRTSSSTTAPTLSSSPATTAPGFSVSPQANSSSTRGFGSSPAKVQMLPRQTINLLEETGSDKERERSRSGSPAPATSSAASGTAATSASRRDDDDSDNESVEYVKNPFNDDD